MKLSNWGTHESKSMFKTCPFYGLNCPPLVTYNVLTQFRPTLFSKLY